VHARQGGFPANKVSKSTPSSIQPQLRHQRNIPAKRPGWDTPGIPCSDRRENQ